MVSHVKRGETVVCMLDHAVNSVLWVDSAPSSVSRKILQNDVTLSTKKGESIVTSTGNTVHFVVKGDCSRKTTLKDTKNWLKRRVKSIHLKTTPDALNSCPSSVQL